MGKNFQVSYNTKNYENVDKDILATISVMFCCDMNTEKLAQVKVEVPEVTQSEIGQKQKLRVVLDMVNRILQLPPGWKHQKWSVDSEQLSFWILC